MNSDLRTSEERVAYVDRRFALKDFLKMSGLQVLIFASQVRENCFATGDQVSLRTIPSFSENYIGAIYASPLA